MFVFQSVKDKELAEKTAQNWKNHGHWVVFGVGFEVVDNAIRSPHILGGNGILQFKNIEILADADVFFNAFGSHLGACRQQNLQFVDLVDNLLQIIAQMIGKQSGRSRFDFQSLFDHMLMNPLS